MGHRAVQPCAGPVRSHAGYEAVHANMEARRALRWLGHSAKRLRAAAIAYRNNGMHDVLPDISIRAKILIQESQMVVGGGVSMITRLKRAWLRFWLRRFAETARYADLGKLYAIPDPWSLSSEGERYRFEATNAAIREMMPDCRSLLELGCGEGLQTRWLLDVSTQVTGLDVSDVAVSRARQRLPGVTFRCGKAEEVGRMFPGHRFDLVTLCEMLHYSRKGQDIISQVQALTDHMIVTSYADRPDRLRVDLSGPGWFRMPDIVFGELKWNCYGWRRP